VRKIEIELGGLTVENPLDYFPGVIAVATLWEDKAPQTCDALWDVLPIKSRSIHTFWFGQCWRTEDNYLLLPVGQPPENPPSEQKPLVPGDVVYFSSLPAGRAPGDRAGGTRAKIMVVFGPARSDATVTPSCVIGHIDENLEGLTDLSRRILYEGPKNVVIRRRE
jgi:hypothetical protein